MITNNFEINYNKRNHTQKRDGGTRSHLYTPPQPIHHQNEQSGASYVVASVAQVGYNQTDTTRLLRSNISVGTSGLVRLCVAAV